LLLLLSNAGQQLAASLGGNILTVRMPVQKTPPTESEQGAALLKNEEVRYRQNHLVIIRKTGMKIINKANLLTNPVQQISRTVKLSTHRQRRNPATLCPDWFLAFGGILSAPTVRKLYLAGLFIDATNQSPG
jgi:hypothetical protein